MLSSFKLKSALACSLGVVILAACSANPPPPPQLDASVKKPLNQRLQADPYTAKHLSQMRITVAQALEYYVPAGYQVFNDEGVDLSAYIRYDNSRPWTESLGLSLSKIGIEMVADLDKKTMLLKALPTSLAQILDTYVPADFKVYVDQEIDTKTIIRFNHKQPWVEELGRSIKSVGLDLIANLDKKIILIRTAAPKNATAENKGVTPTAVKQIQHSN